MKIKIEPGEESCLSYDLNKLSYKRIRIRDKKLLRSEGLTLGRFDVSGQSSDFTFLEHSTYHGFESINVKETNAGNLSSIKFKHRFLHNELLKKFVAVDKIPYLPLSSQKKLGIEFRGYGILAETIFLDNGVHTIHEISITQ